MTESAAEQAYKSSLLERQRILTCMEDEVRWRGVEKSACWICGKAGVVIETQPTLGSGIREY